MKNELNVVMASDDNYSFLLGNAIYSLFDTNIDFESINVYIIDDHICTENKKKLELLAQKYDRSIFFIAPPSLPDSIVVKGTLNLSTFYRLAICSLLPETVKKVLYLDCDVLVRRSLFELWNTDIDEYYLAGVHDTTGKYARTAVELQPEDVYVNAGVLLINIDKWKRDDLEKCFFSYLTEKDYKVEFNDQGIINHCCKGKIKIVNPKYDFMNPYARFNRKQLIKIVQKNDFYSESEIEEAKKDPYIIHYAGYAFSRPWYSGSKGQYVPDFVKLSKKSGFSFTPQKQPSRIKYKVRKFANCLPNDLSIGVNNMIDRIYIFYSIIKK